MKKVVLALLLCCNVAAAQATKGAIGLPHRPAASAAEESVRPTIPGRDDREAEPQLFLRAQGLL